MLRTWIVGWLAWKRLHAAPPPDPGDYTPSLDFSDARNSMYIGLL